MDTPIGLDTILDIRRNSANDIIVKRVRFEEEPRESGQEEEKGSVGGSEQDDEGGLGTESKEGTGETKGDGTGVMGEGN